MFFNIIKRVSNKGDEKNIFSFQKLEGYPEKRENIINYKNIAKTKKHKKRGGVS